MKEFMKKELKGLDEGWEYNIIDKRMVEYTITRKVPLYAGTWVNYETKFPKYLEEYKNYYQKNLSDWVLLPQYRNNPPTYTIKVSHPVFTIKLTARGQEFVNALIDKYTKRLNKWTQIDAEAIH